MDVKLNCVSLQHSRVCSPTIVTRTDVAQHDVIIYDASGGIKSSACANALNPFLNLLRMQARLLHTPREMSRFILSTLKHLCREPRFRHQWRSADHLSTLCHKWFAIPEPLQFDGNDINDALRNVPALKLDIEAEKSSPNKFGIYHNMYRERKNGDRKNHNYYLCDPDGNECVINPPVGKWYDTISSLSELQKECDAIACSTRTTQRELLHDVIDIVSQATHLLAEERPRKRTHLDEEVDNSSTSLSSEPPKSPALSTTLPPVVLVVSCVHC
jgi:hypothetical protein